MRQDTTDQLAHELFEEQARRTPDAEAVSGLSYRELDDASSRWARHLRALGVGPDTLVALALNRDEKLLTAFLAVLKAGGGALPLDMMQPAARVRTIFQSSRARFAIVADDLSPHVRTVLNTLPRADRPTVMPLDELDRPPPQSPPPTRAPIHSNLTYVIYTSGSTGTPKGAMIHHEGMRNHLSCKVEDLSLTSADVVAQSASHAVDVSVWQFLAVLLVGGRVEIISDEVARDPVQLLRHVEATGVTVLEIVPTFLQAMLAQIDRWQEDKPRLSRLRLLIVNGEVLPPELCKRWLALYPSIRLINAYGPTECSDDVTHYHMSTLADVDKPTIPIGRPLENVSLYVLDADLQRVRSGESGELHVGGISVGRGYWRDPARTANVFVPDPFSDRPGARMYRTGDVCRWRRDGTLDYVGRTDHMVKIRGHRVELGEIEAALTQHPSVAQAVVTVSRASGDAQLVAHLLAQPHASLDRRELSAHLRARLPGYMLPAIFAQLDELPLLPNGKVDRGTLSKATPRDLSYTSAATASLSGPEQLVAAVWGEAMGVDDLRPDDNFFDLGGHSILAAEIVASLASVCSVELSVQSLFEAPTVRELAQVLVRHKSASDPEMEWGALLHEAKRTAVRDAAT